MMALAAGAEETGLTSHSVETYYYDRHVDETGLTLHSVETYYYDRHVHETGLTSELSSVMKRLWIRDVEVVRFD